METSVKARGDPSRVNREDDTIEDTDGIHGILSHIQGKKRQKILRNEYRICSYGAIYRPEST